MILKYKISHYGLSQIYCIEIKVNTIICFMCFFKIINVQEKNVNAIITKRKYLYNIIAY